MSIRIVETTVSDKAEALAPLVRAHRAEVERIKPMRFGEPDWKMYSDMEKAGIILSLLAYDDEEIVGYSVNILGYSAHRAGIQFVQNEALYLTPSHRGGMVGPRLISETEKVARDRGAAAIIWPAKTGTLLSEMLPLMGYIMDDVVYAKELS